MKFTTADLMAYEAKRSAKIPPLFPTKGCDDEGELHQDILDECARRLWLPFHGSMRHKTHRTVGEPDFTILADDGRVIMVEAKSKKEKPSPEQLSLHAWARRLGHTVHVVRSFEEFLRVIA